MDGGGPVSSLPWPFAIAGHFYSDKTQESLVKKKTDENTTEIKLCVEMVGDNDVSDMYSSTRRPRGDLVYVVLDLNHVCFITNTKTSDQLRPDVRVLASRCRASTWCIRP